MIDQCLPQRELGAPLEVGPLCIVIPGGLDCPALKFKPVHIELPGPLEQDTEVLLGGGN